MSLSEEEKKKFMSMVVDNKRFTNAKKFIRDFPNISYAEIKFSGYAFCGTTISLIVCNNDNEEYIIDILDSNDEFSFIKSIFERISPKMIIAYSSAVRTVYIPGPVNYGKIYAAPFRINGYIHYNMFLSIMGGQYFDLNDNGAVVGDEVLKYICKDEEDKRNIAKIYVSYPESMSKEMREKIKPIYDALPCEEKLLLELGCDV